MAKLLGITREQVCRLESGGHEPSLETMLCYQILFDTDLTELMPELYRNVYVLNNLAEPIITMAITTDFESRSMAKAFIISTMPPTILLPKQAGRMWRI